jgi:ribosomal-protein-alanine N-acetyltransferase
MPFRVRPYAPDDFETIFAVDQECYPRGIAYSRRTLRYFLAAAGNFCVVAEIAPEKTGIIGFAIAEAQGHDGHIITLDVLTEHRRAGVGTALLREIETQLTRRDVRNVYLETAVNNEAGVAFWRRHGYRAFGRSPKYYLGRVDALLMRKDLHSHNAGSAPRAAATGEDR